MSKKRVVIVSEGEWGKVTPLEYEEQVQQFARTFERATGYTFSSSSRTELLAESVQVVATAKEASELVRANTVDVVVFISRSMISEARELKKARPRLKVVVLTGLIPDDEIIFVDKTWIGLLGEKLLNAVVFH